MTVPKSTFALVVSVCSVFISSKNLRTDGLCAVRLLFHGENVNILTYPNKTLLTPCSDVGTLDLELVNEMISTVRGVNGFGLAAPQVGVSEKLVIINHPYYQWVLVNPTIDGVAGESTDEEGCLSLPGVKVAVKRHAYIRLTAFDIEGRWLNIECSGMLARVIQHELDHLNAKLIIDYLPPEEKRKVLEEYMSVVV